VKREISARINGKNGWTDAKGGTYIMIAEDDFSLEFSRTTADEQYTGGHPKHACDPYKQSYIICRWTRAMFIHVCAVSMRFTRT
jgi:hypothetical protein